MTLERAEANSAESRQAFTNFDDVFAEAYSDKGLGNLKAVSKSRTEAGSIDFGTQDIFASADKQLLPSSDKDRSAAEPKINEASEAERVTPLAQLQRAERIAANADVDQSATVLDKEHLPSNLKDNSSTEPKMNEIAEADRVTPLAQSQRLQRIAANADLDQATAVKDR